MLHNNKGSMQQSLKVVIGSVGSKSNKVDYVKSLLSFLAQHPNTSKTVLWTPTTTRVASLYSAADVYVINSQVGHIKFLLLPTFRVIKLTIGILSAVMLLLMIKMVNRELEKHLDG